MSNIRRKSGSGIWIARISLLVFTILAIVIISKRFPQSDKAPPQKPVVVAPPPAPLAPVQTPVPSPVPMPVPPPAVDFPRPAAGPVATDGPLDLPVLAGRASLDRIARYIGEDQLPSRKIVRIEEMLDRFSLRPIGNAAVVKGVTLSTETLACPWKPSATLLLVSFRGAAGTTHEVKAKFTPDPSAVRSYRLLGFEPDGETVPLPSALPAGRITTLAIEIETSPAGAAFGAIAWSVDGHAAPSLSLVHNPDSEPSGDARFAALVCTYGQWLAGDRSGIIDAELVAALARELASAGLPADRSDFLTLIDRSLDL